MLSRTENVEEYINVLRMETGIIFHCYHIFGLVSSRLIHMQIQAALLSSAKAVLIVFSLSI